ncbi:Uncharacterised protein [Vibrio cholerae]|nr:Uncharacterised protein [Vibrio cholerae]
MARFCHHQTHFITHGDIQTARKKMPKKELILARLQSRYPTCNQVLLNRIILLWLDTNQQTRSQLRGTLHHRVTAH